MAEQKGQLAWQPDLIATFGNARAVARLDNFRAIEPDPEEDFIESPDIIAQIICGGRGTGKTTLIYCRARYLHRQNEIHFVRPVPPNGFFLNVNSIVIEKEALDSFSKIDAWRAVWQLILGILFAFDIKRLVLKRKVAMKASDWHAIFKCHGDDMMRDLVTCVFKWSESPHDSCVEKLINLIMAYRPTESVMTKAYIDKVTPLFSDRMAQPSIKIWTVFVDRIDEALAVQNKVALLRVSQGSASADNKAINQANMVTLAQELWASAQAGYAIAAHDLGEDTNGQLVALGTMREEAYPTFIDKIGLASEGKISSFLLRLKDDEPITRSIFNLNVKMMRHADRCTSVEKSDPNDENTEADLGLCGYKSLFNRPVFGYKESPYSYLYRHSFGTPRGLMTLGQAVSGVRLVERKDANGFNWRPPTQVIDAVNKTAVKVFVEYRDNIFPPWDPDYNEGIGLLQSNIINRGDAERLDQAFSVNKRGKRLTLMQYLYENGLIGVPTRSADSKWIQTFRASEEGSAFGSAALPPDFKYILLHPALSAYRCYELPLAVGKPFYNPWIVVSPGSSCPEELIDPVIRFSFFRGDHSSYIHAHSINNQLKNEHSIFDFADSVGSSFLAVLGVAHQFYGVGHLDSEKLVDVATRLSRLGYIPERLGKADAGPGRLNPGLTKQETKKSAEQWIGEICNYERHGSAATDSATVSSAKRLLHGHGLSIHSFHPIKGNTFCLCCNSSNSLRPSSSASFRPIGKEEILIEGLSIDAYLDAL